MNFIDALRSGRPFRRKGDGEGWRILELTDPHQYCGELVCDMIEDDWEIQEKSVTVTASELKAAVEAWVRGSSYTITIDDFLIKYFELDNA